MKATLRLVLLTLAACASLSSVAASAQSLYPVQGPQTWQNPPVVINVKLTGSSGGQLSAGFPDGENFNGTWATATVNSLGPMKSQPLPKLPLPNLAFAWDAIYTQGYFLANVLGMNVGTSVTTGSKGTVLQLEFLNGNCGVGVDSRGNVYKMVWTK